MMGVFRRNRRVLQILSTVGVISVLLLYYYGVYIPNNERYVLEQNFRMLRTSGDILTEKVKAYHVLINNYASSEENGKTIIDALNDAGSFDSSVSVRRFSGWKPEFIQATDQIKLNEQQNLLFPGVGKGDKKNREPKRIIGIISLDHFLKPILSNVAFDGFFLVANDKIIYDGTQLGLSKDRFIKSSGLDKKLYQSCDTQVEINGIRYRVFAMPLALHQDDAQITIGGFVKEKGIQSQINTVRPYVLISLFFVLTMAMLLMPFFKIWVLGKKDKLNLSDVSAVYITSFLLVAVLSLWFMNSGRTLFFKDKRYAMASDSLIQSVHSSLKKEMDSAKSVLKRIATDPNTRIYKSKIGVDLKYIFRILEGGAIETIGGYNDSGVFVASNFILNVDLSKRDYFQKIKTRKDTFAIEPVISRTDGKFEMVFATRNKVRSKDIKGFVTGLSVNPKSVSNAILPKGNQIALINREGKVILHTVTSRNMQENLVDELQNGEELKALIKAGVPGLIDSRYFEKQCEIHVKPLEGYPGFFLVRIRDNAFWQQFKMDALLATATTLLFILGLVFLVSVLVYQFVTKGSVRKNGRLYLSWIYPQEDKKEMYKVMSLIGTIILIAFLAVFVGCSCPASGVYWFLLIWILIGIPMFIAPLFSHNILKRIKLWIQPKEPENSILFLNGILPAPRAYVRWYSYLIFVKLCYFSMLPACYFYLSSQQYYFQKYQQNLLFDFASQWLERDVVTDVNQVNKTVYGGRILIHKTDTSHMVKTIPRSMDLFDFLQPQSKTQVGFAFPETASFSEGNLKMRFREDSQRPVLYWKTSGDSKVIAIESRLNNKHFPEFLSGQWFVFYLLFIAGLLLIYLIVHQIIKRIFGVQTPDYSGFLHKEEEQLRYLLSPDCLTNFIFIQGLTSSFKGKMIKRVLTESGEENHRPFVEIDMLDIPDETEYKEEANQKKWEETFSNQVQEGSVHKIIVLKHFEYNFEDPHTSRIKLNILERLTQKKDCKIVITSAIEPTGLLEALETAGSINENQRKILTEDINRWNVLLGKFVILMVSIHQTESQSNVDSFAYELESNEFLAGLSGLYPGKFSYPDLRNQYSGDRNDAVLIDLHTTTLHFYRDIWHSLMPEEKVMLYDLAEEGLLNTSNYLTLFGLMRKGLILKSNGMYFLLNHSFRHFILTAVTEKEMEKAESKIDENSIWKEYQGPILVTIAALLWFVLYANQDQFGQIFPVITALATGLPTIVKLFSFFIPGASKT
ncbi:MAG TPA: hypothetical protein PLK63_05490 [Catalimonadaceae bacterium]|nr:hypothetical protein [Catalimonadaceae bacterium]